MLLSSSRSWCQLCTRQGENCNVATCVITRTNHLRSYRTRPWWTYDETTCSHYSDVLNKFKEDGIPTEKTSFFIFHRNVLSIDTATTAIETSLHIKFREINECLCDDVFTKRIFDRPDYILTPTSLNNKRAPWTFACRVSFCGSEKLAESWCINTTFGIENTRDLLTRFEEQVRESVVNESWARRMMMVHFWAAHNTWGSSRMRTWYATTCDWRLNVKVSRHAPVSRNQVPTFCGDWKNHETQAPANSLPRVQTWSESHREFDDAYSVPEATLLYRSVGSVPLLKKETFLIENLCWTQSRGWFKLAWNDFLFVIFWYRITMLKRHLMTVKLYFLPFDVLNNRVENTPRNALWTSNIQPKVPLPLWSRINVQISCVFFPIHLRTVWHVVVMTR